MAARAWNLAAIVALAVVSTAALGAIVAESQDVTASKIGLAGLGLLAVVLLGCLAYVAGLSDPRYLLAAAIVLAPMSGNWEQLHIPGIVAPDRLLLILAIAAVLLRVPAVRERPALQIASVHYVMAAAVTWALLSANFAETLLEKGPLLQLVETFGILPFAVFLVAPVVYRTDADRRILLVALVALGAYLSLTQIFTMVGPRALVFPRYILDDAYGLHGGRGRGPFADAVANGFALFVCAVACTIAARTWANRSARVFAVIIALLCVFGTMLTLERSIWVATVVGAVVWLALDRRTRWYILPGLVVAALTVVVTLNTIPALSEKIHQRAEDKGPVWDRQNITHAAIRMIEERPLTGFGWAQFEAKSRPYFELNANYPLTAVGGAAHNFLLSYAVQLGLIGLLLWALSLVMGVGGAIATRGPPDLEPWRKALIPIGVFFLVMANFVPPTVFPNLLLWLWAGVVWSARYPLDARQRT